MVVSTDAEQYIFFALFRFAHLEPTPSPPASSPTPLAFHPQTASVLLPSSHPSSLQLFSPSLQTALLELEVSPSNRVSAADDKPVDPARVERAVLSSTGQNGESAEWMATSEIRDADEEEGGAEERMLKAWRWDENLKTYVFY